MNIKQPNIRVEVACSGCGNLVQVSPQVERYIKAGKSMLCPECMHGESNGQWTKAKYRDYLNSEHWQLFRKKVLRYYGCKCYLCGRSDLQIDIHHNDRSRLGNELMSDVIPLCHPHHEAIEAILKNDH